MIILCDDNTASVKCFFYCFEIILSRTSNKAWPFGKKVDISSAQKTAYLKKRWQQLLLLGKRSWYKSWRRQEALELGLSTAARADEYTCSSVNLMGSLVFFCLFKLCFKFKLNKSINVDRCDVWLNLVF